MDVGTATISAWYEGAQAQCVIKVTRKIPSDTYAEDSCTISCYTNYDAMISYNCRQKLLYCVAAC